MVLETPYGRVLGIRHTPLLATLPRTEKGAYAGPGLSAEQREVTANAVLDYLETIWYQPHYQELVEVAQEALEQTYGRRWPRENVMPVIVQAITRFHDPEVRREILEMRELVRQGLRPEPRNQEALAMGLAHRNRILARYGL